MKNEYIFFKKNPIFVFRFVCFNIYKLFLQKKCVDYCGGASLIPLKSNITDTHTKYILLPL